MRLERRLGNLRADTKFAYTMLYQLYLEIRIINNKYITFKQPANLYTVIELIELYKGFSSDNRS